jgi:hypothetical protein
MHRRRFLCLAVSAAPLLMGHTPYRQWKLYRQTHLLIFTSRDDAASDALGERIAARLRAVLPESNARVARAPHVQRIASLITTDQADVAVLSHADALALYRHAPPFDSYRPIALRVLAQTDQHQLVCREDFQIAHGYLLAEALAGAEGSPRILLPQDPATAAATVPAHPGVLAYLRGEPLDVR